MALDPGVLDSVINANFKTVAEQIAVATNNHMHAVSSAAARAVEDSVQDQRNSRLLGSAIMGSLTKRIVESDLVESLANAKNATADLPNREVELGSASAIAQTLQVVVATLAQVMTKLAQSTPPETGVPATVVAGK